MRFLISLAIVGCAVAAPRDDPSAPMLDGRIVGGTTVNIDNFPYQLSLRASNSHTCGASVISAYWAVTAAHCVYGRSVSILSIRSGSSFHGSGGTIHAVVNAIYHPSYNSATVDYDIAVIRVSTAFSIGTAGVSAIDLPTAGATPTEDAMATVSGWGTLTSGGNTLPNQLQAVDVPIISTSSCRTYYGQTAITDRMLCAGFTIIGGKDACQGDSGGPLVVDNVLVGVVSWGKGCAEVNHPGVYTHVGVLRDWIKTYTGI